MRKLILAISLLAFAGTAGAITNEESYSRLTFNFNTPGARALAMGGAFIGLADDVTAAEANPAGLTTLLKPEISAEIKFLSSKNSVLFASAKPLTGTSTPIYKDYFDQSDSVSFLSFVYPHESWAFSFSRHEQLSIDQHYSTEGAVVPGSASPSSFFRLFPAESNSDISISNYVFAAAYQPMENVKVGASIKISRLNWKSTFRRFTTAWFNTGNLQPGILRTWDIDERQTKPAFNIGAIVKPTEWASVGVVYKRNATFEVTENFTAVFQRQGSNVEEEVSSNTPVTLNVPDTFGAGLSLSPSDKFVVNFDVQRVRYSDLLDNFQIALTGITRPSPSDFNVDDATEIHVGAEYVFSYGSRILAVRGGLYTDPEHSIVYSGGDPIFRVLFPRGEDVTHGTFGMGVVFSGTYQLDVAADIAKSSKAFIISTVAKF